MMADGAGGIQALMAEADRLGMTISGEQAAAAAAFDDKWQGLVATLRNASNVIAVAVLPYLSQMIDMVMAAWPAVQTLASAVGEALVSSFGRAYNAIGALLEPFAGLGSAVSDTLNSIMGALTAGDVAAAADVFWASLDVAWAQGIAAISDQWYAWRNGFLDVFDNATAAIAKGMVNLQANIVGATVDAIAEIMNKWTEFKSWLSSWVIADMAILGIVDNAEEVQKTLDEMTSEQTSQVSQQAEAIRVGLDMSAAEQVAEIQSQADRDRQQRADMFAKKMDEANAQLAQAQQAWANSVATAATAASTAANQPDAATTAGKKFDELIGELKAGDIATRVDKAVQQSGTAQDLRTTAGAGVLTRIINQQGTLSQQQLDQLREIRGIQRQLLKATQDGMIGWVV
jgi:phage-related protein